MRIIIHFSGRNSSRNLRSLSPVERSPARSILSRRSVDAVAQPGSNNASKEIARNSSSGRHKRWNFAGLKTEFLIESRAVRSGPGLFAYTQATQPSETSCPLRDEQFKECLDFATAVQRANQAAGQLSIVCLHWHFCRWLVRRSGASNSKRRRSRWTSRW